MPLISETLNDGRVVEYKLKNPPKAAKAATAYKITHPPPPRARRRRRRGGRGRRGRRAPTEPRYTDWKTGDGKLIVPAAIGTTDAGFQFMRRGGIVKHKEWGIGNRFVGRSILGYMTFNNGATQVFYPELNSNDGSTDANMYAKIANARGRCFPLIPAAILRLNYEAQNWGRYAFRGITLEYDAISTTSTTNGYAFGISKDVTVPMSVDWANTTGNTPLYLFASLEKSVTAAAYQGFRLKCDDYNGDRTWVTQYPLVTANTVDADLTHIADEALLYYPYFYCARATSSVNTTTGFGGWVYICYSIDFYSPISSVSPAISHTAYTTTSAFTTTTTVLAQEKPIVTGIEDSVSRLDLAPFASSGPPRPTQQSTSFSKELDSKLRDRLGKQVGEQRKVELGHFALRSSKPLSSSLDRGVFQPSYGTSVDCPCCGQLPCKKERFSED